MRKSKQCGCERFGCYYGKPFLCGRSKVTDSAVLMAELTFISGLASSGAIISLTSSFFFSLWLPASSHCPRCHSGVLFPWGFFFLLYFIVVVITIIITFCLFQFVMSYLNFVFIFVLSLSAFCGEEISSLTELKVKIFSFFFVCVLCSCSVLSGTVRRWSLQPTRWGCWKRALCRRSSWLQGRFVFSFVTVWSYTERTWEGGTVWGRCSVREVQCIFSRLHPDIESMAISALLVSLGLLLIWDRVLVGCFLSPWRGKKNVSYGSLTVIARQGLYRRRWRLKMH